MNETIWELSISRAYYPYKQEWNKEIRDEEFKKVKRKNNILYFDNPNKAIRFFFDRIVPFYEKKYKNFVQCWIDISTESFSNEHNYEIVDYAEYRPDYDNYDFELSMSLNEINVKKRLSNLEKFKNLVANELIDFKDKKLSYDDIWDLIQNCKLSE